MQSGNHHTNGQEKRRDNRWNPQKTHTRTHINNLKRKYHRDNHNTTNKPIIGHNTHMHKGQTMTAVAQSSFRKRGNANAKQQGPKTTINEKTLTNGTNRKRRRQRNKLTNTGNNQ
jgi:hypothetical protein